MRLIFTSFLAFLIIASLTERAFGEGLDENWKFGNKTTLNLTILTGNSESTTIGGNEKFTAKRERVTNTLTGGVLYVRNHLFNDAVPAKTTDRNIFAKDKVRWDFYKRTFAYFGGGWLTNRTSGVDQQFNGFAGMGYRLIALARHTLDLEGGYRFNHRYDIAPFPDEGSTQNAALGLDYLWQMTDKSSLENEADYIFDMANPGQSRLASRTEMQVEIVKHLTLSFGFQLDFDNHPVPTFLKLNTVSTTGLNVIF